MQPSESISRRLTDLSYNCGAATLALLPVFAWAQSTALPEVVINAGRLEQKIFDAPAAVQSVDARTIRASGPQVNVSDVLAGVPGVVALNRNNFAQDLQISIRGFGARAAFGVRGIRLIADGIPATIPDGQGQASTISLTSADRIEVLRGPLAQLYGNAAGGVIQSFTREAPAQPEAMLQVFGGSNGLARSDWQFSGRSGKVGLVADYSTFDTDGWREHSGAQRRQLNTVLTLDATPQTRLKLVLNSFEMPHAQDPLGLTAAQLASNPRQAGTNAILNNTRKIVDQDQLGAVLEQRFTPDLRLQGRAYWGTRDNLQYQASAVAGSPNANWVGLGRTYRGAGLQLNGHQKQALGVPMDWVVGVDWDRSSERRQAGAAVNGIQSGQPSRDERNIATNEDFFAQTHWYLGERWSLVAGLRSSRVTLESDDAYFRDGVDGSGSVTYRATNPVLGLTWHARDNLNVYVNGGKGFETPTLAEVAYSRSGSSILAQFNPGLSAARSRHLEIGAKWRPSPTSQLDAAWFRILTDNEIVSSLSSAGRTAFTNAAKTRREGVELSYNAVLHSHWRAQLALTAMKAEYDAPFSSAGGSIAAGNRLPAVPSRLAHASVTWSRQARATVAAEPLQGGEVTLEWTGRDRLWANDRNTAYAPGYGAFNLRWREAFQWRRVRLETHVGIDNLTDRRYVGSVISNQAQQQFYEPGLPRNWVLGARAMVPL